MLIVTVPACRLFNEENNTFAYTKEQKLMLEHSLLSISKWESKWKRSFFNTKVPMTDEEVRDYIKCMTLTQNVDPNVYYALPGEVIKQIQEYIADPMTATTFNEQTKGNSSQFVTSELIYYWMIAYAIPFECQKWHINRLLTLIRICEIKNRPNKKMSKSEIYKRNRQINSMRRNQYNSKG